MGDQLLTARERFRQAGRVVLRQPDDPHLHAARVDVACDLEGAEPLQGALADLLHGCAPDVARHGALLARPAVRARLAPHVGEALRRCAGNGQRLAAANAFATRWSVLTSPSLDVPRRALLCSTDDARVIAARAIPMLRAGDAQAEDDFLAHCEGAGDALAFMVARRALTREGYALSARWEAVSAALQQGVLS